MKKILKNLTYVVLLAVGVSWTCLGGKKKSSEAYPVSRSKRLAEKTPSGEQSGGPKPRSFTYGLTESKPKTVEELAPEALSRAQLLGAFFDGIAQNFDKRLTSMEQQLDALSQRIFKLGGRKLIRHKEEAWSEEESADEGEGAEETASEPIQDNTALYGKVKKILQSTGNDITVWQNSLKRSLDAAIDYVYELKNEELNLNEQPQVERPAKLDWTVKYSIGESRASIPADEKEFNELLEKTFHGMNEYFKQVMKQCDAQLSALQYAINEVNRRVHHLELMARAEKAKKPV